jgi:hypothetical protein
MMILREQFKGYLFALLKTLQWHLIPATRYICYALCCCEAQSLTLI